MTSRSSVTTARPSSEGRAVLHANASQGHQRHRHRPPYRPPRRPPGRHGDPALRPLRHLRDLGQRRITRRDAHPERRDALPRTPPLQGHRQAQRPRHLLRDRRGRRRDERLHGEGVHLLLRAGPGHRPAAGHRRRLRHADRLADRTRGRRRRARRHPRRDRHDGGRPGRLCARPVRAHHARRHTARPSGPRYGRHGQRPEPRPDRPLLQEALRPHPPGRRGGGQRRPRHRRTPGPQGLRARRCPHPHRRGPHRAARGLPPCAPPAGSNC